MRTRILIIALLLVAVAAFLILRRGSSGPEEVQTARRGAAEAPVARGAAVDASGRRLDAPMVRKPGGAMPSSAGRGDAGGARQEGAPGSIDRGEALVIDAGKRAGKKGGGSGSVGSGDDGEGDVDAAVREAESGVGKLEHQPGAGGAHDQGAAAPEGGGEGGAAADGAAQVPGILFNSEENQTYTTTDPVEIPDSDKFGRDAGSVNFWVEPGWEGDNQDDADFIDLGDGGLKVVKNVNFLRFEFTDANGVASGVGVEISDWKPGDSRQVTATWDGTSMNLYVDGKLVSQRPNPGLQRSDEPGPVTVGSLYPPERPIAPGVINGVQVFDRPLGSGEVANLHLTPPKKK